MFTNINNHGGTFKNKFEDMLSSSEAVKIASGYIALQTIDAYSNTMIDIAKQHGNVQILVGMAFYEGMTNKQYESCLKLHEQLSCFNNSGIHVAHGRRFHGKVYTFQNKNEEKIFVGSSNFSPSGLYGNIECTIEVIEAYQKNYIQLFLNDLFKNHSKTIDQVVINTGKRKPINISTLQTFTNLPKHTLSIDRTLPHIFLDLDRIAEKSSSNLNVYFGKGRLNRVSNKITPRPWYEIEIISSLETISSSPNYPIGNFDAYTDDGIIIPMRTQGDYFKNLRSRKSLQLFGIWLKGKLEKSGVLNKYQPVTTDTLKEYGNSQLKLYKIDSGKYFMEF